MPPDEVSELPLMCFKMEYAFPLYSNRWDECETNWAKLRGHLLINQAEKHEENIGESLHVRGQRHAVF